MRILFIGDPNRPDTYDYLSKDKEGEYVLLWWEDRKKNDSKPLGEYAANFREEWYWKDFPTPAALLRKLCPDKIVFLEIIDLRQIALLVAANKAGITTFYLEHGAAGDLATAVMRWKETSVKRKWTHFLKRFSVIGSVVKSKWFYYSVWTGFNSFSSRLKYWLLPFRLLNGAINKVLSHNLFPERVPRYAIVFSRTNLPPLQLYTGLSEAQALFTGLPMYDKYYAATPVIKDHVVFIDHPYLEENVTGWDVKHHAYIAQTLFEFAETQRQKVFVKLHPRSDRTFWEAYKFNPDWITILQFEDCTQLYLESKLMLGFSSSLVTAFLCARKNYVLLGWNPEPGIFGMNFAATGLCHQSLQVSDLYTQFDYWIAHNLTFNEEKYAAFLHQSNEPFDGRAGARVIEAIHTL